MINTVEIPVKYKFVIDRLLYEINIRSKNLAFMLHKNLDNPEFLDTELYARLENELIDVLLNRWVMIDSIFNNLNIPVESTISMNNITGVYSATWVKE